LKLLPAQRVIIDGEIAALDEKGRSSFQLLKVEAILKSYLQDSIRRSAPRLERRAS
jgi:ATP-dependent DNA ligase